MEVKPYQDLIILGLGHWNNIISEQITNTIFQKLRWLVKAGSLGLVCPDVRRDVGYSHCCHCVLLQEVLNPHPPRQFFFTYGNMDIVKPHPKTQTP